METLPTKEDLNEIPGFIVKLTNGGKNNNGAVKLAINVPKKFIDYYNLEPGMTIEVKMKVLAEALKFERKEPGTQESYNYTGDEEVVQKSENQDSQ